MAPRWSLEQITASISGMGKSELKKRIRGFKGRFRLDFTDDYLNQATADRLRHILLAAMINAKA
ncbi:hypothetical protein ACFL6U_00340 [Planctomycetota bacterium]